jgi:hypothetical protein
MKDFIVEILKKFISTIVFAGLMFVASYSFMTGEFPPKIDNMKKGFTNLQNQLEQVRKLQQAKLKQAAASTEDETQVRDLITNTQAQNIEPAGHLDEKLRDALIARIRDLETRVTQLELGLRK